MEKYSRNLAIDDGVCQLSYNELHSAVSKKMEYLKEHELQAGDCLLLAGKKTCEFLTTMLACLLMGVIYVPVELPMPERRIDSIARETKASGKYVISSGIEKYEQQGTSVLDQEDVLIFYTSGSTGAPKGVRIHAENIITVVKWVINKFDIIETDRFSAFAPWHFDLSIIDIYTALLSGASIHCVSAIMKAFPVKMVEWLQKKAITVVYMVPTALRHLLKHSGWSNRITKDIRCILFAGEVFPFSELKLLRKKFPLTRITNLYGPTETNICTWCEIPSFALLNSWKELPIGRSIPGFDVLIDGSTEGELICMGGAISPGYVNDPSSDKFFSFLSNKAYRTGDLAKNTANGFVFMGRSDRQVKLYGYRIDLFEIEACLRECPAVYNAAVLVISNQLVAFVSSKKPLLPVNLSEHCSSVLPKHCCPNRYEFMEKLPITQSEKIDYKKLENYGGVYETA